MSARPAHAGSPVLAAAPHRVGTVALVVHDLDAVAAFYEEVIGLQPIERNAEGARLGTGATALVELVRDPLARALSHHFDYVCRGWCGPDVNVEMRRNPEFLDTRRAQLKAAQREHPSLVLGYALAQRALADQDSAAAVAALDFAPALKSIRLQDWPIVREMAQLLAAHGAPSAALQVYANLAQVPAPTPDAFKAMLTEARQTADAAGDLLRSLEFGKQLSKLDPLPAEPAAK